MECWLATLNVSSAIMSHALEQVHAPRIGLICECFNCSSLLACKAATVQLSICFPIGLSHIHLAASLYLCPADCFQDILFEQAGNSHWNKFAFLRHIKWHIHSMSIIRPMECWLATLKQECFNCSSRLACKAATVQLSICFPISLSRIHLAASLYLCPADCFQDILFEQAGNSHWDKLAFIKWHICSVGAWKYLT